MYDVGFKPTFMRDDKKVKDYENNKTELMEIPAYVKGNETVDAEDVVTDDLDLNAT